MSESSDESGTDGTVSPDGKAGADTPEDSTETVDNAGADHAGSDHVGSDDVGSDNGGPGWPTTDEEHDEPAGEVAPAEPDSAAADGPDQADTGQPDTNAEDSSSEQGQPTEDDAAANADTAISEPEVAEAGEAASPAVDEEAPDAAEADPVEGDPVEGDPAESEGAQAQESGSEAVTVDAAEQDEAAERDAAAVESADSEGNPAATDAADSSNPQLWPDEEPDLDGADAAAPDAETAAAKSDDPERTAVLPEVSSAPTDGSPAETATDDEAVSAETASTDKEPTDKEPTDKEPAGAESADAGDATATTVLPAIPPETSDADAVSAREAASEQETTAVLGAVDNDAATDAGTAAADDSGADGSGADGSGADVAASTSDSAPTTEESTAAIPVADGSPWWRKRPVLIAAAVLGLLVVLYGLDLLISSGKVPREVTVAEVDIGGLSKDDAKRALQEEIGPRLQEAARVSAAEIRHNVPADIAKPEVDWDATVEAAAQHRYSPWARLVSLFSSREVPPVMSGDREAIEAELGGVAEQVDEPAVEGSIRFEGTTPFPVIPEQGRELSMDSAIPALLQGWARGGAITLPVKDLPVRTTEQSVRDTLENFARPAVSGQVVLKGEGKDATLAPEDIPETLRFEPGKDGALNGSVDPKGLAGAASDQLASTEQASRNASMIFEGKKARVRPAVDGHTVDWAATAKELTQALPRSENRAVDATYHKKKPDLTTEELKGYGIKEIIGEFTTNDFAYDSGINIRTVAEEVNGAIVEPGGTFSLNGHTGPRGLEQGYVGAAVIENGEESRAVGGGISQFATTMYNATYFAAMKDVEHKEHSYYISRYPMGREATVFQNPDGSSVIDLKFKNEEETGVAIQTIWTPSSITVRLWGTKRYEVESITGDQYSFTGPPVVTKSGGESCTPTGGSSGFSVDDTRVIKDLEGNEVRRDERTVVYNGQPQVVCPEPEPEPDPRPADGNDNGGNNGGGNNGGGGNDGGDSNNGDGAGSPDGGSEPPEGGNPGDGGTQTEPPPEDNAGG